MISIQKTLKDDHQASSVFHWVYSILAAWAKEHPNERMPIDGIYDAFSKLKEKEPRIFNELDFESTGKSMHSRKLEDILNRMSIWGVVGIANPGYKYVQMQVKSNVLEGKIKSLEQTKLGGKYKVLSSMFTRLMSQYK